MLDDELYQVTEIKEKIKTLSNNFKTYKEEKNISELFDDENFEQYYKKHYYDHLSEENKKDCRNFNIKRVYSFIITYIKDINSLERINQLLASFILFLEKNIGFNQFCFFYVGKYYASIQILEIDKSSNPLNNTEGNLKEKASENTFKNNENERISIVKNKNTIGHKVIYIGDLGLNLEKEYFILKMENLFLKIAIWHVTLMHIDFTLPALVKSFNEIHAIYEEFDIDLSINN